jgi:hypothetical protein
MFDKVASELHGLTSIVVSELGTQLEIEIDSCFGVLCFSFGNSRVCRLQGFCVSVGKPQSEKAVFLERPGQGHVEVHAAEMVFPTVATVLKNMEARRDTSEDLAMARMMQMELQLVQAENDIIKDTLHAAIARLLQ